MKHSLLKSILFLFLLRLTTPQVDRKQWLECRKITTVTQCNESLLKYVEAWAYSDMKTILLEITAISYTASRFRFCHSHAERIVQKTLSMHVNEHFLLKGLYTCLHHHCLIPLYFHNLMHYSHFIYRFLCHATNTNRSSKVLSSIVIPRHTLEPKP